MSDRICYAEVRFFKWQEAETSVSLWAQSGSYGGDSEVLVVDPIVFRDDITIKVDEGGTAFTLGARDFKGVQCVSYQRVTGALSQGAHPGGFNGQDAYNDMLITGRGDAVESVVRRLTPLE